MTDHEYQLEEIERVIAILRGLADGVLMVKLRLEELNARLAEVEHQQVTNAFGRMHSQRDIIE